VVTQLLDTLDLSPDGALVQRLVGLDQVEGEEDVVGGEGMEDLQVFRKNEFVDSLFGENA
jgi:hypothetical protein